MDTGAAERLGEAKDRRAELKERLIRYHGMVDDHFLLYLKEVEYRFNRRRVDQMMFVAHLPSQVLLS